MFTCAVTLSTTLTQTPADGLKHDYLTFFSQLDILPVLVPNTLADPCAYVEALGVRGLILTGGGDVDPARYGQPNRACTFISSVRDETEFRLLDLAMRQGWPVLGICRGFQVINVFLGGGLVQDIPTEIGPAVPHDESAHPVAIPHPGVQALTGLDRMTVNSFHHQGVNAATLADSLAIFAFSPEDEMIEGIVHPSQPVLGVQWHPERPGSPTGTDLRLFRAALSGDLWR